MYCFNAYILSLQTVFFPWHLSCILLAFSHPSLRFGGRLAVLGKWRGWPWALRMAGESDWQLQDGCLHSINMFFRNVGDDGVIATNITGNKNQRNYNGINEPADTNQGNSGNLAKNQSRIIWDSHTNWLVDRHKIGPTAFEVCLCDQATNMIQTSPEKIKTGSKCRQKSWVPRVAWKKNRLQVVSFEV